MLHHVFVIAKTSDYTQSQEEFLLVLKKVLEETAFDMEQAPHAYCNRNRNRKWQEFSFVISIQLREYQGHHFKTWLEENNPNTHFKDLTAFLAMVLIMVIVALCIYRICK